MALGFAFKSVCYDTLANAAQAACNDTAFWNTTQGYITSCRSYQTIAGTGEWASRMQFNLLDAYGNTGYSTLSKFVQFPSCLMPTVQSPAEIFNYVLFSVLFVYLTSLGIGAIIRFIRSV